MPAGFKPATRVMCFLRRKLSVLAAGAVLSDGFRIANAAGSAALMPQQGTCLVAESWDVAIHSRPVLPLAKCRLLLSNIKQHDLVLAVTMLQLSLLAAGAVLSHGNLIANAAGSAALMTQQGHWGPGDTHLSFLPLAHIFERKNLTLALHFGLAVAFYSGDARRVFEDAAAVQPSLFMAVPRVFNRLYDEVMAEVGRGSALRRRLFHAAYACKAAALEAGGLPLRAVCTSCAHQTQQQQHVQLVH
jgi:hypothetical protein